VDQTIITQHAPVIGVVLNMECVGVIPVARMIGVIIFMVLKVNMTLKNRNKVKRGNTGKCLYE
jgi:hypothetical protein